MNTVTLNDELHAKREALRAQGYVVCSSQMYFPKGTKLGWVGGLAGYSDAELRAELEKRAKERSAGHRS